MAGSTPSDTALARPVPLAELRAEGRRHSGTASPEECTAIAARFGLPSIRSLSWDIDSAPWRSGVRLTGRLRASVVQECVVTLDPVPAEIDETFERGFLPMADLLGEDKPGAEHEIRTDSEIGEIPEPLTDPLDIGAIMAEELGVALDPYPRKEGLDDSATYTAQPGNTAPLTDEDVKPFAGLADLAKKMNPAKNGE